MKWPQILYVSDLLGRVREPTKPLRLKLYIEDKIAPTSYKVYSHCYSHTLKTLSLGTYSYIAKVLITQIWIIVLRHGCLVIRRHSNFDFSSLASFVPGTRRALQCLYTTSK
jgi:hypothetical protein